MNNKKTLDDQVNAINQLSIIIPVFNEENSILKVINNLKEIMNKSNLNFEIIAVDDGSTDKSYDLLNTISDIKVYQHNSNIGYGQALKTGIKYSKFENIVITDCSYTLWFSFRINLTHLLMA
ncbi:MAG: glycosyltransferase [Bacteroidetes bacterium]|nr:glycosyltransferase [Bacteroidota bacterium]